MAWIYLAGSVASRSLSMDMSDHSFTVSQTDTAKLCSCPISNKDYYHALRYGMTCKHCKAIIFPMWILSMQDFHARTSVLREMELAWSGAAAQDFFLKSQGLSAKQTRNLYFSKTYQQLELAGLMPLRKHLHGECRHEI